MKKGIVCATLVVVSCVLTGCIDQMPDLSQEESALIAEYAGDLLLKYSPNYHYRVADLEEIEESVIEETEISTETETTTEVTESNQIHVETELESETESAYVEAENMDIASELCLDGFSITYDSYEISDAYPMNETAFQVTPSKGKKLLILHFTVKNETEDATKCDLFALKPVLMIIADGKTTKVKNTLLSNDITSFIEEMGENSSTNLVALFDVEEEPDSLILQVGETSCLLK